MDITTTQIWTFIVFPSAAAECFEKMKLLLGGASELRITLVYYAVDSELATTGL